MPGGSVLTSPEQILLVALSLCGFLISLYFTAVFHGVIESDSRLVPRVCRIDRSSCALILKTREARLFGVPNFYLGLIFYGALMAAGIFPSIFERFFQMLHLAAAVAAGAGLYLAYALLFRLKVTCVLCFLSHLLNLFLIAFISLQ